MEPFTASKLPIEYEIDKELLRLTAEANEKYGEYKSLLNTLNFDASFFLDSVLLEESFKSTQIEGTQISQDEMYYLRYLEQTDDSREIQNLKNAIDFAKEKIPYGINSELVNEMHKILLNSVRGEKKNPGKIRDVQNWIGPRGCTLETATFVPPKPEEVYGLLQNLYDYMNNAFVDPIIINLALSHAQFETIHAYKDGNGRLGRALIPVQMAVLDDAMPILFMSEILELYKPSYQRGLMEMRRGNIKGYLKFFLQCVIDQCNSYIFKIERMKTIFEEDYKKIEAIRGNSVYKVMPFIMKQIVFTKKEIHEATGLSVNVIGKLISQLTELGIVVPDDTVTKRGFRYQRIYDIFVGSYE